MKLLPIPDKVAGCIPFLARAKLISEPVDETTRTKLEKVITAAGDRVKLFSDILQYGGPFFRPDPLYDPKGVEKRLKKPVRSISSMLSQRCSRRLSRSMR